MEEQSHLTQAEIKNMFFPKCDFCERLSQISLRSGYGYEKIKLCKKCAKDCLKEAIKLRE